MLLLPYIPALTSNSYKKQSVSICAGKTLFTTLFTKQTPCLYLQHITEDFLLIYNNVKDKNDRAINHHFIFKALTNFSTS